MLRNLNGTDWQFLDIPYTGVLGSDIPLLGEHGGSVMANEDIDLTKRYRSEIATAPASGTTWLNMDGSGYYDNSVGGTYQMTYYVWEDAVKLSDADGVAIATFSVGNWSYPAGIPSETAFGIPSYTQTVFVQTSRPAGIPPETAFGVPTAYTSGGLQTSTPSGIEPDTAFGTPGYYFSGQDWILIQRVPDDWTEIEDIITDWTEE